MTERRFNEDEVAAIFKRATETQQKGQRHLPSGESGGMTLAQLQEIGREVGISPELVSEAATAIDRIGRPTSRRFLGMPIGVGRTVELGRRLTDEEWERLVVDLRETFDARGHVRDEGSFRQWTNGNLQALLEPTPSGHRLRLRTLKGDARIYLAGGLAMFGITTAGLIQKALSGAASQPTDFFFAVLGAALFGWAVIRLPGWAQTRRRQMEEVAARLADTTKSVPASSSGQE